MVAMRWFCGGAIACSACSLLIAFGCSVDGNSPSHESARDAAPLDSAPFAPVGDASFDTGDGDGDGGGGGADPTLYGAPFALEAELPFHYDGTTDRLEIPFAMETAGIVLRMSAPRTPGERTRCYQLDSVSDSNGVVWIPPATTDEDWQATCSTCKQRASVGRGYGLFSLPNDGEPLGLLAWLQLRVVLRDCESYSPFNPNIHGAPPSHVRVEVLRLHATPATRGRLKLLFITARGSTFADGEANPLISDAVGALRSRFETADIDLDIAFAKMPLADKEEIVFGNEDQHELDALYEGGRPTGTGNDADAIVPIIFSPCLVHTRDGHRESLQGYVPRIPAGFSRGGIADAVFIEERNCNARPPHARSDGQILGKVIAHELGHYLGLYHSIEADTRTDHLSDTDANNLMYFDPLATSAEGFSPSQIRVLRMHPYVLFH